MRTAELNELDLFDPERAAAFGRLYRDVLLPADREPHASRAWPKYPQGESNPRYGRERPAC
jgi:hypothetical protein